MKYKYIISLFLVGVACRVIGVLFKITHAPHADQIILVSTVIIVAAIIMAIIKIITTKNKDSFLNK